MKKKYLIAILPALLVLSSCQAAPKAEVLKEDIFIEDTEAHDEIFGNDLGGRKIAPYKINDPVTNPDSDVSIGVQTLVDQKGTPADSSDDTVSIRFVAPVTFGEGQLAPTNAVWTRTVSKPDGSEYPKDTGNIPCSKAYTQLENGDHSAYTIAQFNEDHSTAYTHFVVYTLRGIPLEEYSNYYVCAYLSLSGTGGVELTTKAVAISVDQTKALAFNSANGYFAMSVNGGEPVEATSYGGGNLATFSNVELNSDDVVRISGFKNTKFYVYGNDKLRGEVSAYNLENSSDVFSAKYKGTYTFFVNSDNEVWTSVRNVVRPLYIRLDYVSDNFWFNADAVTRLYAFKKNGNELVREKWFDVSEDVEHKYYVTTEDVDPTLYDYVIVARLNPSNSSDWWNQTIDIRLDTYDADDQSLKVPNCIAVWTSKQDTKQEYGWEHR